MATCHQPRAGLALWEKLCPSQQQDQLITFQSFEPIPQLEPLVSLPEDILKDNAICYRLVRAAECGALELELASRLAGGLSHSRWLTTGQSFLLLYMSANHDPWMRSRR